MENYQVNGDSELEFANKIQEQFRQKHAPSYLSCKPCQENMQFWDDGKSARSFERQSNVLFFEQSSTRFAKRKSKEHILMKSLRKCKIQKLTKTFIGKLKQGAVLNRPHQLNNGKENTTFLQRMFGDIQGIESNSVWNTLIQILSFMAILQLMVIYSLVSVFSELQSTQTFQVSRKIALVILVLQTITNFFVKSFDDGKMIIELTQIIRNYLKMDFKTDMLELILLGLDIATESDLIVYCRLRLFLKLPFVMDELDRIKNMVCTNVHRQNQWGIMMVLITNFIIAHFISIFLNAMAFLDADQNWWVVHKLDTEPWFIRYIYGYYWATNIMLTVGFGDYAATNWLEALALTFIEMVSCITLAYNINCVGNLLGSLRAQQLETNKNLRTFSRMYDESKCQNRNLESRIKHYIVKAFEMKTNFNLQSQHQTLSLLPEKLREQFVKHANEQLFENLEFIKQMSSKTLNCIALKLQKKLTHPQEMITKRGEKSKLHILQSGQLCYVSSQSKRGKYQQILVQKVVAVDRHYKQLSLRQFIRRQDEKHHVVSGNYSVVYALEQNDFDQIVRENKADFERYCVLRDQDNLDFLIVALQCDICDNHKHSKFDCPRLHYVPLKEIVCLKYRYLCDRGEKRRELPRFRMRFGSNHPNHQFRRYSNLRDITAEIVDHRSQQLDIKNDLQNLASMDDKSFGTTKFDVYNEGLGELDKMFVWRSYFPRFNVRWHD